MTSWRATVYCTSVNGLEAAIGWIFSQRFKGDSHTEYNVSTTQHITCIGYNKQSNLSE